jgi:hypothetical protein
MTQHSFGPMTQNSYIGGPVTQHSYIGPMTQHSYIGPMTQHSYIGPMTQHSFGPITQHCLVPVPSYSYAQKVWIGLISSPLLEFYIRTIFVILQSFDIVFENDFFIYKCLQINLTLRRHFYRCHDYKVLVDKVTHCSATCIHPTPVFIKKFINYIFALQVIYIFVLEPVLSPAVYLFDVLIYDTCCQVVLCCKDLDYSEPETNKATGGGPSYELNYDDLSCYSDQVSKNMKYVCYTYVLVAEKKLLQSKDLIAISNIPLNIILPKLTVKNLKLIIMSHKLRMQSKMKSQELQSIINEHICENCESYVYIFQCFKNEIKSDKGKADLLKATKNSKLRILNYIKLHTWNQ